MEKEDALADNVWSFMREGLETEEHKVPHLTGRTEWPTLSTCSFFDRYVTFCRLEWSQMSCVNLLPFDVVVYVGSAPNVSVPLTLRQHTVLAPLLGCLEPKAVGGEDFVGYPRFDGVCEDTSVTALFRFLMHNVPRVTEFSLPCQLEDSTGARRPWARKALREIRSFLSANLAPPPAAIEAAARNLATAAPEEIDTVLSFEACSKLLKGEHFPPYASFSF